MSETATPMKHWPCGSYWPVGQDYGDHCNGCRKPWPCPDAPAAALADWARKTDGAR